MEQVDKKRKWPKVLLSIAAVAVAALIYRNRETIGQIAKELVEGDEYN